MRLNEIFKDSIAQDVDQDSPDIDYQGEIDLHIRDIEGLPYSMFVNEADSHYGDHNGITFMVTSGDDDGVVWEIDLGVPYVSSAGNYEPDSDHGPGGYDEVEWDRHSPSNSVRVDDMSNNPTLKKLVPKVTRQLNRLSRIDPVYDSGQYQQQITQLFTKVLGVLNNTSTEL